jgi:hypothetical protein
MRSITWVWGPEHVAAARRAIELRAQILGDLAGDVGDHGRQVAVRLEAKLRAYRPDEPFKVTKAQLRVLEEALQDLAEVDGDVAAGELVEIFDEAHRLAEAGIPRRLAGPRLELVLEAIEARRSIFPLMPLEA